MKKGLRKKRKNGRTQRKLAAVQAVMAMTDEEVIEQLLVAGEGLFWERNGEQVRPLSPETVHAGLDALWGVYWALAGEAA